MQLKTSQSLCALLSCSVLLGRQHSSKVSSQTCALCGTADLERISRAEALQLGPHPSSPLWGGLCCFQMGDEVSAQEQGFV